jgi:hypothetical protein
MSFVRTSGNRRGILTTYYNFSFGINSYMFFISAQANLDLNYIQHTIFLGSVVNDIFSFNLDLNSFNVYGMRNTIYSILDDYESTYVDCSSPHYYFIRFSKTDPQYQTKFSFTLQSLIQRYGNSNVSVDENETIKVFLCS